MTKKKTAESPTDELEIDEPMDNPGLDEGKGSEGDQEPSEEASNIVYVGKKRTFNPETGKTKEIPRPDDQVPLWRRNGAREFTLPDGATQKKGFYHPEAEFLLKAYRTEFKRPKKKGEK